MNLSKNDEIELEITDIAQGGAGVGKTEDFVFFVPGALPGDLILAGVTALKKSYGYARIIKILKPSKDRISAPCDVSAKCGGCSVMPLAYDAQLRYKEKLVLDSLVRIGGFDEGEIKQAMTPIIGMEKPYHYRNKATYPVGLDKSGKPVAGFFAPFSHRIVEHRQCLIGHPDDEKIIRTVLDWMEKNRISAYDEIHHKGVIRHILIRHSHYEKEAMVCLVVNAKASFFNKVDLNSLALALEKLGITSLMVNENTKKGNTIMGSSGRCLWGKSFIEDKISIPAAGSLRFRISAESFFQVNSLQMEKLYGAALDYADINETDVVWDIYCGIGTITDFAALKAKKVVGIEQVPQAIENARENAKLNGLSNIHFICDKAENVLNKAEISPDLPDVVILDPPRSGAMPDVLDTILKAQPKRIVYVSCNPGTLARDLKYLCNEGEYAVSAVTTVDQFCHGVHVETICLLSRETYRPTKDYIKVGIDAEDYYAIKNSEKE